VNYSKNVHIIQLLLMLEDVAPRSVLDEQLSHLVIWVQEKGKRWNGFCVMRKKKKINTRFFKIALESL